MKQQHDNLRKTKRYGVKSLAKGSQTSINGIIIPVEWDEMGNAVTAAISTFDEEEFFIDNNSKGDELKTFIRKEAEIQGILRQEGDKNIIRVIKYRIKPDYQSTFTG